MIEKLKTRRDAGLGRGAAVWALCVVSSIPLSACGDGADEGRVDAAVDAVGAGSDGSDQGADAPEGVEAPDPAVPIDFDYSLSAAATPRLTSTQYANAIHDLFGGDVVVPTNIEPDAEGGGLLQVGAAAATISPRGVERFEAASYAIAGQALAPERRGRVVPCAPAATRDDACATQALAALAPRAWRRPVDAAEIAALVELAGDSAEVLGEFHAGLEYAVAGVIQSPSFLFRVEIGVPDGEGSDRYRFTDHELASRLSFLLWNTIPDAELIAAAEQGLLSTDEGLFAQATRLMASPRAREGLLVFFDELYGLHKLTRIVKDPTVFASTSSELGPAARRETQLVIEDLIFNREADFRELLTTRRTFIDRRLAALYDVRAPSPEGFAATELPAAGHRRGLLGQAGVLALYAHSTSTSATLRGKFIRTVLLCGEVPPPPSGVDTSIPAPTEEAVTLRERVAIHLRVEECASCHALMDPLGLALENFDGIGAYRELDNGAPVDASGDLDGQAFETVDEFVDLMASDPRFTDCVVERLVRYANSSVESADQAEELLPLKEAFEAHGFRVKELVLHMIMSPAFRTTGAPQMGAAE